MSTGFEMGYEGDVKAKLTWPSHCSRDPTAAQRCLLSMAKVSTRETASPRFFCLLLRLEKRSADQEDCTDEIERSRNDLVALLLPSAAELVVDV